MAFKATDLRQRLDLSAAICVPCVVLRPILRTSFDSVNNLAAPTGHRKITRCLSVTWSFVFVERACVVHGTSDPVS